MATPQNPWNGGLRTFGMVVGLVIGAAGGAFGISRASPADVKAVEDKVAVMSERLAVTETTQASTVSSLEKLEKQLVQMNGTFAAIAAMMHKHD